MTSSTNALQVTFVSKPWTIQFHERIHTWVVNNGERSFACYYERDAIWLRDLLNVLQGHSAR